MQFLCFLWETEREKSWPFKTMYCETRSESKLGPSKTSGRERKLKEKKPFIVVRIPRQRAHTHTRTLQIYHVVLSQSLARKNLADNLDPIRSVRVFREGPVRACQLVEVPVWDRRGRRRGKCPVGYGDGGRQRPRATHPGGKSGRRARNGTRQTRLEPDIGKDRSTLYAHAPS